MGIFSRLGTLIKSNINDLITKAEDPEKMLSQVLLEMQQQLVEVGQGRRDPDLRPLLASANRALAGPTAPAHGLWLVEVNY